MIESLAEEIRTLHALLWSERDPDGRGFAPLADAYRRAGKPRQAFELLNEGRARLPDFAPGHVVAARLYSEQGLLEEGELASRRALELDAENVAAMAALVRVLEASGRADEAAEIRETLGAMEPEILSEEGLAGTAGEEPESAPGALETVRGAGAEPSRSSEVGAGTDSVAVEGAPRAGTEPDLDPWALADAGPEEEPEDLPGLGPMELVPERHPQASEQEDVLDVGALAPEGGPEDDIFEIGAFAPEPAGAPDEAVLDAGALAPEAEDEAEDDLVLDVDALAPGPVAAPESVDQDWTLDIGALAPEPEPGTAAGEEAALDIGALAPEEPVLAMEDLAPDHPDDAHADGEEAALDIGALAPEEPVLETQALAPEEEPVLEMDDLAPEPGPEPGPGEADEAVLEVGALAPEPVATAADESDADTDDEESEAREPASSRASHPSGPRGDGGSSGPRIYTRTLGELYAKQGFLDRAVEVFQQLVADKPGDPELATRLAELEAQVRGESPVRAPEPSPPPQPQAPSRDEELEALARDLAGHREVPPEVDTPFAWSAEQESEDDGTEAAGPEGERIGDYFQGLLSWRPGGDR